MSNLKNNYPNSTNPISQINNEEKDSKLSPSVEKTLAEQGNDYVKRSDQCTGPDRKVRSWMQGGKKLPDFFKKN